MHWYMHPKQQHWGRSMHGQARKLFPIAGWPLRARGGGADAKAVEWSQEEPGALFSLKVRWSAHQMSSLLKLAFSPNKLSVPMQCKSSLGTNINYGHKRGLEYLTVSPNGHLHLQGGGREGRGRLRGSEQQVIFLFEHTQGICKIPLSGFHLPPPFSLLHLHVSHSLHSILW